MSKAFVQKPAPHFQAQALMPDGSFKTISLTDYKAFSDRYQEFKKLNTEVVAASVDSVYSHLAWTERSRKDGGLGKMAIPIIGDLTKQVSRDYGVLIEEGEDAGAALRGLFIISDKGIMRYIGINDLPVGRSVDEVLRLVQAFKHTDEFGDVCPANWHPSSATMIADPEKAKEYFSKVQ